MSSVFCVCRTSTLKECAEACRTQLVNVHNMCKQACATTRTTSGTGSQVERLLNACCTSYAAGVLQEEIHMGTHSYGRPVLQPGADQASICIGYSEVRVFFRCS